MYAAGLAAVKGIAFYWERPNYEILIFVLGFLVPFSVMGLCYYKIFGAARRHARELKMTSYNHGRDSARQLKAAKTIALVILAFFICWCPFYLLNLCFGLFPTWKVPGPLIPVAKWLHYANSALNPIIYACFNQEYRSAFRALLTRKKLRNGYWESSNGKKQGERRKTLLETDKASDVLLHKNGTSAHVSCRENETKESRL